MKAEIKKYQTSDYLQWDSAMSLIRKLYLDKQYRWSVYVGASCFLGLRVSDIKTLTWRMLLADDTITIYEMKTNKRRVLKLNADFQRHVRLCHDKLAIKNDDEKFFLSRKKVVYSTQRINMVMKTWKKKYNLKIDHLSTHTWRKTFGRQVFENSGNDASIALMRLADLYGHSSPNITKIYLGIKQKELLETYSLLEFS